MTEADRQFLIKVAKQSEQTAKDVKEVQATLAKLLEEQDRSQKLAEAFFKRLLLDVAKQPQ